MDTPRLAGNPGREVVRCQMRNNSETTAPFHGKAPGRGAVVQPKLPGTHFGAKKLSSRDGNHFALRSLPLRSSGGEVVSLLCVFGWVGVKDGMWGVKLGSVAGGGALFWWALDRKLA